MLAVGLAFVIFTSCWISTEADADSNRRQLDIPAMKSYFEKLFPGRSPGEFKTSTRQNKDKAIIGLITPSVGTPALNSPAASGGNRPSNNTILNFRDSTPGNKPGNVNSISTSGRVRSLGLPEQSRTVRQKGELGNPQLKNAALVHVASPGSPIIGGVAGIPLSPVDPYGLGVGPQAIRPPVNLIGSPLKGLNKGYGVPKAYGPPKAAKKPSKGYGAPPLGASFGNPIVGVPNVGSPIPGTVPIDPLGPIGAVPNDPTLADPGLVSSILNSPPPYVRPSFPGKNPGSSGLTGDGPFLAPLQKPPFKGSGLNTGLIDLPLNDGHAGLGDSGPLAPIQNGAYSPFGDDFPPYSPIQGPDLHLLDGPVNIPLPGANGYDEGLSDDLGHVSSFSYFRGPEFAKDLDYRFVDAGRIIAEQFHLYMTDRTGFPGIVRFRELEEKTTRGAQKSKEISEDKYKGTSSPKPGSKTRSSTTNSKRLTSQSDSWSSLSSGHNRNVKDRFLSQVS